MLSRLHVASSLLTFCVASFLPVSVQATSHGWTGVLSYGVLRNRPVLTGNLHEPFHDALSATIAGYRRVSTHLLLGPEIGYHGFQTVKGIQVGPEWDVDSNPGTLRAGVWEAAALARVQGRLGGLRPYAEAGGGPYLPGNFVIESRQAKIKHRLQAGITAGLGVHNNTLGIEGRWHLCTERARQ